MIFLKYLFVLLVYVAQTSGFVVEVLVTNSLPLSRLLHRTALAVRTSAALGLVRTISPCHPCHSNWPLASLVVTSLQ